MLSPGVPNHDPAHREEPHADDAVDVSGRLLRVDQLPAVGVQREAKEYP